MRYLTYCMSVTLSVVKYNSLPCSLVPFMIALLQPSSHCSQTYDGGANRVLAEPARVSALQAAVRERKDLRRFAISGDYWILSPTTGGAPSGLADPTRWAAWQLHDPTEDTGCVTLLRRPNATEASITLGLRGLSASATFNVSFASGFMVDRAEQMSGEKLAALSVQLEPSHSIVLRYTRL